VLILLVVGATGIKRLSQFLDRPMTRWRIQLVLQRHYDLIALAHGSYAIQSAVGIFKGHDGAVTIDRMAGPGKVPLAMFAWGGFCLLNEMRRGLRSLDQRVLDLWDGE
jgi:hypothetical protein